MPCFVVVCTDSTSVLTDTAPGGGAGLSAVFAMAPQWPHACAVRTAPDGDLQCWGSGALQVPALLASVGGALGVASLAMSDTHGCALMNDGSLHCFGLDDAGQVSATSASAAWTSAVHGAGSSDAFRAVCVHHRYALSSLCATSCRITCPPPPPPRPLCASEQVHMRLAQFEQFAPVLG